MNTREKHIQFQTDLNWKKDTEKWHAPPTTLTFLFFFFYFHFPSDGDISHVKQPHARQWDAAKHKLKHFNFSFDELTDVNAHRNERAHLN